MKSLPLSDDELVVAFLDMVENHKLIVENSGVLTVAALKHLNVKVQEDCFDSEWWKHGYHYHVFCGSAWSDQEKQDLYYIGSASGQAGRTGQSVPQRLQNRGAMLSNWTITSLSAPTVQQQWN